MSPVPKFSRRFKYLLDLGAALFLCSGLAAGQTAEESTQPSSTDLIRKALKDLKVDFFKTDDGPCIWDPIKYKTKTIPQTAKFGKGKDQEDSGKVAYITYLKGPVKGGCGPDLDNEDDVKNCCRFERVPWVKIKVQRDVKRVVDYEYRWMGPKIPGIPIKGGQSIDIDWDDVMKTFGIKPTRINRRVSYNPGEWSIAKSEVKRRDRCSCEQEKKKLVAYSRTAGQSLVESATLGDPWGIKNPRPPIKDTPWPGGIPPGQKLGDVVHQPKVQPKGLPNFEEPTGCTAANDISEGELDFELTKTYHWTWDVREVTTDVKDVLGLGCKEKKGKKRYWWVDRITINGEAKGTETYKCTAKPETHNAHADCDEGCTLDASPTAYSHVWTREVTAWDPVMKQMECSVGPGITMKFIVRVDWNLKLGPWEEADLDEGMSGETDFCKCEGEGGGETEEDQGFFE